MRSRNRRRGGGGGSEQCAMLRRRRAGVSAMKPMNWPKCSSGNVKWTMIVKHSGEEFERLLYVEKNN